MSTEMLRSALSAIPQTAKVASASATNAMAQAGVANAVSHTAATGAGVLGAAVEMGLNSPILPVLGVAGAVIYTCRKMYQGLLGGPSQGQRA